MLLCLKKAVRVVGFSGLHPHTNAPCSWEKRKTGIVGEYHLLPLVYRPALVISTPLQPFWMSIVESRGFLMAVHLWYPASLSWRRTVLVETGLFRFSSHFGGSGPMPSSHNAFLCTSVSVGWFGSSAGITPVAGGFSLLVEFRHGPWYGSSRKSQVVQLFWWLRPLPCEH